jgi:PTS system nitrogen regulatory IIA component
MASIRMVDLVTPERIIPKLYAENKLGVIAKLSHFAATKTGMDGELIRRRVLERQDLATFAVGGGIALPHATLPRISKPIGIFARLKRPVNFRAADGRPTDLVLLVLAPDHEPGTLLRALSCAARRLRDWDVVERLRGDNSREAAHAILTSDSWRGNDPTWSVRPNCSAPRI